MLTRVLISLPLVKIFSFLFGFSLYSDFSTVCCVITACGRESLYNRVTVMALVGFLCSSNAGDYMGSLRKGVWRTVLYNGFWLVLGYRDWPTLNKQWCRLS